MHFVSKAKEAKRVQASEFGTMESFLSLTLADNTDTVVLVMFVSLFFLICHGISCLTVRGQQIAQPLVPLDFFLLFSSFFWAA